MSGKTETITIRCTPEDKEKLKENAYKANKKAGSYILDYIINEPEKGDIHNQKLIEQLVILQEGLNHLHRAVSSVGKEIKKEDIHQLLEIVEEGVKRLWEN